MWRTINKLSDCVAHTHAQTHSNTHTLQYTHTECDRKPQSFMGLTRLGNSKSLTRGKTRATYGAAAEREREREREREKESEGRRGRAAGK